MPEATISIWDDGIIHVIPGESTSNVSSEIIDYLNRLRIEFRDNVENVVLFADRDRAAITIPNRAGDPDLLNCMSEYGVKFSASPQTHAGNITFGIAAYE